VAEVERMAVAQRSPIGPEAAPSRRSSRSSGTVIRRPRLARALPYLAMLPALVTFLLLLGYPVALVVATSFQHLGLRELINGGVTWIGLQNYQSIVANPEFLAATVRTFVFMAVNVALTIVLGMAVAVGMSRMRRSVRLLLSIAMVLAWATPALTGSVVFQWLFDSKLGVVNWALSSPGIFGDWLNHSWFDTGLSTFGIISLLIVWQAIPFVAFSLFAGILSIPPELYEAAKVDGGSERQVFRYVTLPALAPLLLMLAFLSVIWDFKVFTQVWTMRQGGPDGQTVTLSIFTYITGLSQRQFGIASAISVVRVLLLLIVLIPYIRRMLRQVDA
jgi:N,N'-diacetylchitobiose transport system permease protein